MVSGGDNNNKKSGKAGAVTLFRIGVSAVVLLIVLQFIPLGDVWARIKQISPFVWFGVFFAFLFGHALAAAKWRWMIGAGPSYPTALKAHFAGLAANLALPGVAGGDIVRAGMVMKGASRKTSLAIGSLADRLIDTAALLVIAAAGAIWLGASAGVNPAAIVIAAAVVIGGGIAGFLMLKPIAQLMRSKLADGKGGALAVKLAEAFEDMAARPATLAGCAALSVLIQTGFVSLNALIASNLGAGTTLAMWVFAWPLAKLVATLPISFGGLGVREAGIASLMAPLGVAAAGVVAASLVWQSVLYASGAVGALAQVFWRRSTDAATEPVTDFK